MDTRPTTYLFTATKWQNINFVPALLLGQINKLVVLVVELTLAAELSRNPHLHLITAANPIRIGNNEHELNQKPFAVYRPIATAWKEQWLGTGPHGDGGYGWLSAAHLRRHDAEQQENRRHSAAISQGRGQNRRSHCNSRCG